MSIPSACCVLPPVESAYSPRGVEKVLFDGDLPVYETGVGDSKTLLICAYDIFGVHPSTKQFCDKIGSSSFRVVMPDFFRGQPITDDDFKKGREAIVKFIETRGTWGIAKADLTRLILHYRSEGVEKFGMFGFCWGARVCVDASIHLSEDVAASVLIHPSLLTNEDAPNIKSPTLLIPTKDDMDFGLFYEVLKTRFREEQVGHTRFEDVHHGFASARANLEDPVNVQRLNETLQMSHNFFLKNLS